MSGPFKLKYKNSAFPFKSPLKKDVKMYNGNGEQVTVDDKELGKPYYDENLDVNWRNHNFKDADGKKQHQILYEHKPGGSKEGPVVPMNELIKPKRNLA